MRSLSLRPPIFGGQSVVAAQSPVDDFLTAGLDQASLAHPVEQAVEGARTEFGRAVGQFEDPHDAVPMPWLLSQRAQDEVSLLGDSALSCAIYIA